MRSSLAPALILALVHPASVRAQAPAGLVIERVVVVVDQRPLLLSDVRALAAVRGLGEAQATEAAIDERLMQVEAARLPQAEVPADEEARALALLLETRPDLGRQVPEADLRRLLRRQLAILRYVEFRFRPQLRVSDAEVRQAWEGENAGSPEGPALEDEEEAIRSRLERRALDERIEAWVRELRARADVRYVGRRPEAAGP
jgi:hypothetical protein